MTSIQLVIVGFVFTFSAGFAVAPLLRWLRNGISIPTISSDEAVEAKWREFRKHPPMSGTWNGILEHVIFFFALFVFLMFLSKKFY